MEDKAPTRVVKKQYLVSKSLETGLEPFREPPTLPPIRPEGIDLIFRLALSPDGGGDRRHGASPEPVAA